ncbi:MAG: hypothetical protein IPP37_21995 [Saprospiraceae bacterium]|nr:hypothetical protein [Saprospiraceae bacterium]
MKQPFYKNWLSYFTEVPIVSTGSDYNEVLDLFLVKGRYQLCTEKAIYSYGDKYDNFANAFRQIDLEGVNDVLVLGLGLASIPYILEKIHHKNFVYTGVEIDEEVVYLASKYVLDELKSEVHVYTTDAYTFLCMNESRYDLICMDVFVDDLIPEELESLDFTEMLRDTLPQVVNSFTIDWPIHLKIRRAQNNIFSMCFPKFFPQVESMKPAATAC